MFRCLIATIFLFPQLSMAVSTKLTHDFAEIVTFNKKFIDIPVFKFYKMDRWNGALNITYNLMDDYISNKEAQLQIAALQFRNNVYQKTVIDLTIGICSLLKTTKFDMKRVLTKSNITGCPLQKGIYYANEISPSIDFLPPRIPEGKWMLDLMFRRFDKTIAHLHWMMTITKDITKN